MLQLLSVVFSLFLVTPRCARIKLTADAQSIFNSGKRIFLENDQTEAHESLEGDGYAPELSSSKPYTLVEYSRADCCFEYFLINQYSFGRLIVRLPQTEKACATKAVMYCVTIVSSWPPDGLALACCQDGRNDCPWKNWTMFSLDNSTERSTLCRGLSLLDFKKESFIAVNLFNVNKDPQEKVEEVTKNEYQINTHEVVIMWVCILFFWLMYVGHFAWTLFEDHD